MALDFLTQQFFGNQIRDYAIALLMFLGVLVFIQVAQSLGVRRLKKWASLTSSTIDDFVVELISKYLVPFLQYLAFKSAVKTLTLAPHINKALSILTMVIITVVSISTFLAFIRFVLFGVYVKKAVNQAEMSNRIKALMPALTVVVWVLGLLFLLDNLGFRVSTIMAGLGIGGVAVALAGSVLLNDLFAYFAIMFDQPFVIGDFIIVDDFKGTVERIGIKTTRIRSLGGELLVISNKNLTDSRIRNYKRMDERRVEFSLGVTYDTPLSTLKQISPIIKDIIEKSEGARFDRAHFSSFGDFSLIYQVVYFVKDSDYNHYMDIHQAINFAIREEFDRRGIQFAFPTQTLHIRSLAEARPLSP